MLLNLRPILAIRNTLSGITKQRGFQKLFHNTNWLLSEKLIRLALGMLVSILVARYLGPSLYGLLSYASAIVGMLGSLTYLGLSGLVVQDIVRFPNEKDVLLGTTFLMKMLASLLAFLIVIGIGFRSSSVSDDELWIFLILGIGLFARPFEVVDFWFQSQMNSKFSVVSRLAAFIAGNSLKIIFVIYGTSVVTFAVGSTIEALLVAALLVAAFRYQGFSFVHWSVRLSKAKELLSQSWVLIFAGFFAMINLQVDRIMITKLYGDPVETGVYSVAVTISELWYFIPSAIATSIFPYLIELKKSHQLMYHKRIQQTYDLLFIVSFTVALTMTFIASPLILLLFGDQYVRAGTILAIHIWAGVFMFTQSINNQYILMEDLLHFHLINHGCAALLNILLNFILIPKYGGVGAAYATLVSYAVASYFFLFLSKRTRGLAIVISRSFVFPLRLFIPNDVWR